MSQRDSYYLSYMASIPINSYIIVMKMSVVLYHFGLYLLIVLSESSMVPVYQLILVPFLPLYSVCGRSLLRYSTELSLPRREPHFFLTCRESVANSRGPS